MDFAERQLQKHGWQAGDGLGKEKTGIKEAIKVKIKNDNRGVGHDSGREFTYHWWDHVFNKAAGNIQIQESQDGVQIKNSNTAGTQAKGKPFADRSMLYGQFVKGATLSDGRENKPEGHVSESSEGEEEKHQPCLVPDNEEEVFRMCGGRTAHKGARHGLKLNGKLQRIEEQERLAKVKSDLNTNENSIKKKCSKTMKGTTEMVKDSVAIETNEADSARTEKGNEESETKAETEYEHCEEEMKKKSKKRKKSKKKVKDQKDERGSDVTDAETEHYETNEIVDSNTEVIIEDVAIHNNLSNGENRVGTEGDLGNDDTYAGEGNKRKRKKKKNDKSCENEHDIVIEHAGDGNTDTLGQTENDANVTKPKKLKRKKNRE